MSGHHGSQDPKLPRVRNRTISAGAAVIITLALGACGLNREQHERLVTGTGQCWNRRPRADAHGVGVNL
jgi:hypothetical protein